MPTIDYAPNAGYFGVDTITYRVTNPDGGTDTAQITVTVNDTELPTIAITYPTAGLVLPSGTTSVVLNGTATDNDSVATVQRRINGGPWQTVTGTANWSHGVGGLSDGNSYTVEARSIDASGNISPIASVAFSVASDGTAPTVTITDPTGELPAGTTAYTVAGTATDDGAVALVEYRLPGGSWTTATGTDNWTFPLTGLTDGSSTLVEVRATDDAANVSSIASWTVTVNQSPTANDDTVATDQDVTVNIDVLANDLNIDAGATLTITVQGTNGTATIVP